MNFTDLEVNEKIVKALKEDGIVTPTSIQEQSIPLMRQGRDIIGRSKTGSGKTAAFGVPLLEKMEQGKGIQAIVLAPTRELAHQISGEFAKFGKYLDLNVATIFGGVAIEPQMEKITQSEIVVGTPGRILDHLERETLTLDKVKVFVLDEADRMVDMGFIDDIERILSCTPATKQMLLFGATISREVQHIENKYMNNPATVKVEEHVKKDFLEQYFYDVKTHEKFSLLVHLLKTEDIDRSIIFCSTRRTVDIVTANLKKQGIKCAMIHGKLTQNKRLRIIDEFHNGKQEILIASAVAARGLDISGVTHVINYELPQDPQEYIHRVGRTARAGTKGKAISLLCERDHDNMNNIFQTYDVDIQQLPVPKFEKIRFDTGLAQDTNRTYGNRSGSRGRPHGGQRRSNY